MTSLQHVNPRVMGIRVPAHSGLQSLAAHITQQITEGAQKPFKQVIDVSSCDPHGAGMKPISLVHQVLAACLYPELLDNEDLPADVRQRARRLLEVCSGGSVGSYTPSPGLSHVRQSIVEFIMRRDAGAPSHPKNIFISAGSELALRMIFHLMASGEGETPTGVLTPMPCPHNLPMLLDDSGVTLVPYQLMEDRGWALDVDELHRALQAARGRCKPRAIYISNPGDPTGHLQDRKSIQEVIRFAAAQRLVLLVDEVYQDSVHGPDREFISYKRVLFEMDPEYSETVELVSFHSVSSCCMGECGLRAGYMEVVNMDPEVMRYVHTMLEINISAPVTGQLALELMVNPPTPGDPSYDTYAQEILHIRATLSQNAQRAQEFLNDLPGIICQPATAGAYLYPRLHLPAEIIEQAKTMELEPDVLYCQMLLAEEGVLAGAGCAATPGRHHVRLCILVPPEVLEEVLVRLGSFHRRLLSSDKRCEGRRSVGGTRL